MHTQTDKSACCVYINKTQSAVLFKRCKHLSEISIRENQFNSPARVCHSIQITFNDTAQSAASFFFLSRERDIEGKKCVRREKMFQYLMQVATHTRIVFDLLSLFGCWYYWNNHCSLVVVKILPSPFFSHSVHSHSMVSLCCFTSPSNRRKTKCNCCLNMVD